MDTFGKIGASTMLNHRVFARDYIQDGLIAMWDGIENAGLNTHSSTSRTWVDISGHNRNATVLSSAIIGDSYYATGTGYYVASIAFDTDLVSNVVSVNACCNMSQPTGTTGRYSQCLLDSSFAPNFLSMGYTATGNLFHQTSSTRMRSNNTAFGHKSVYTSKSYVFYINGQSSGSRDNSLFDHLGQRTSMRIGGGWGIANNDSYPQAAFLPASKIHCIRLYSRALTAAEIAHNYAIDKARFNLPS